MTTTTEVRSDDGTSIAVFTSGDGPPLVLVHGTTADHGRWARVLASLEKRFTVHAIDRRGRGASSDAADYAVEREMQDVARVVDWVAAPAFLLGHSYGGLCSLGAALRTDRIAKLVIYEPAIRTGAPLYSAAVLERLEALLAGGRREAVVEGFFRQVALMGDGELQMLRSLPSWPARIAAAHTIPREMRSADSFVLDPSAFAAVRVPTLVLEGGDSPPFLKSASRAAHGVIAGSRLVVLPGQQHVAMDTGPEMFVGEVVSFLVS